MFRRLLLQHTRRGVATGLLALTAFTLSSSDGPSVPTSVAISISAPFRQFLSSTSLIFSQDFTLPCSVSSRESSARHCTTASPLPPPDSSKDVPCCTGCLGRNSIVKAAAAAGPAVVNICLTEGTYVPMLVTGLGSGTIIDPDGTILTCAHCIADFTSRQTISKGKVVVTLPDERVFEGTVVNADFISDVAVVKIHSKTPLPSARLGSSSQLHPGDWVIALGCPLSLQNTITSGIVSCVDRKSCDLGLEGIRGEYLQTNCAINEGNSGGPLINLDGEVVGVNIMKVVAADGLSFAVPSDTVIKIFEQFRKNGRVVRPWLGLSMFDLNEMKILQFKESDASFPDVTKGVFVPLVTPGSPGERAGFQPGDIIIEFGGRPVGETKEIIDIMEDKVGVPLKVLVKRPNNKTVALTVVPEEADTGM